MYTSIVVPLDGSEFGNRALPVAAALARRSDAALHLLHVREPMILFPAGGPVDTTPYEAHERDLRTQVSAVAEELDRSASMRVDAQFLDGPIVPTLQQYLTDGPHDLVVMMTHGRGGLSRTWLGSVADQLTRHAPVPVLLLRQEMEWLAAAKEPLFRRVLVPLDGSSMADVVLDRVLSIATTDVTVFVLLTVIAPVLPLEYPDAGTDPVTGQSRDAREHDSALGYLHGVAEELRMGGALVEVRAESRPHTAQGILAAAEEEKVDLIALSTHGRGSLARFLHGSTADKIVRGATVPVLICGPDDHHLQLLESRLESAASA